MKTILVKRDMVFLVIIALYLIMDLVMVSSNWVTFLFKGMVVFGIMMLILVEDLATSDKFN
jgi:hypothetical protein